MDIQFIRNKIKKEEYDLSAHAHRERNDPRGESCLVAEMVLNKTLHIVCGKRDNRLLIVTVYRPKKQTKPHKIIEVPVFNWQ